jgi:hypothetical protein
MQRLQFFRRARLLLPVILLTLAFAPWVLGALLPWLMLR